MLKRASEMTVEIREKMRGGNGSVKLQNIFNADEIKGKCRLFSQIILEPGCSIGPHEHDQEEEIYYILSGTGIVDDNGEIKNIGPGDAIKTGGGEYHSITNNGQEPLLILAAILLF
ncbi:MAG: cupin domain-containing protein [Acetivibrionales bacterium]|jgi:mannose-6-phosphate isomerase-like protein (cupin superfamily)